VRSYTESYLSDFDNVAQFENTTPVNKNVNIKDRRAG